MIEELKTTQGLMPLILSWQETCNANEFEMDMDIQTFIKSFQELIIDKNSILLGAWKNINLTGIMGVTIFSSPIGKDLMANEHFWYVLPEHRKGIIGIKLLKKAMDWAKSKGCTHFIGNASMLASDLHDNICSIYERIGMKKFETTYIMRIGE